MLTKKWQILEGVVAAIERSLIGVPGASVVPNAAVPVRGSTRTRQVDVLVTIPDESGTVRIGIEVRAKARRLDVTQVEQLGAKLSELELDRRCLVAASDFTGGAREVAVRWDIELRTVAEVGVPDWWLPTAILAEWRRPELIHLRLNYAPEEVEEVKRILAGIGPEELYLVTPTGSPCLLRSFVADQGVLAVDKPELQHLKDQELFTAIIEMKMPDGSFLRCPSGELAVPETISAMYRLHHQVESVPIAAYQEGDSISAFSGVSSVDNKQLTFVAELLGDGSRRLSLSFADAAPRRTRVERVADSVEKSPEGRPHGSNKGTQPCSKARD